MAAVGVEDRLVECVPNFSEGRRPDVIAGLVAVLRRWPVYILDQTSDPDHHRTVITLAGAPDTVSAALFDAVAYAAQHIDLEQHRGVHPRIGATDVVPFVPLRGVTLAECAALARAFGQRVAAELGLPVYLYEAAAARPERENLAYHRRGGYELLKTVIGTDPERQPDYGPAALGPAGALVVGARGPLVAFNLFLETEDVLIAQAIAGRIRAANGGLPGIKALGLRVAGRAQVSVNITDFRLTPLYTLVETVRVLAAEAGTRLHSTELIGLVPQTVLLDYAIASLGLPSASRTAVLEQRLGQVTGDYRELQFE